MGKGRTLTSVDPRSAGKRVELGLRAGNLVSDGVGKRGVLGARIDEALALHCEATAPGADLSAHDFASHWRIEPIGDRKTQRFAQNRERMFRLSGAMQHQTLQLALTVRCDLEHTATQQTSVSGAPIRRTQESRLASARAGRERAPHLPLHRESLAARRARPATQDRECQRGAMRPHANGVTYTLNRNHSYSQPLHRFRGIVLRHPSVSSMRAIGNTTEPTPATRVASAATAVGGMSSETTEPPGYPTRETGTCPTGETCSSDGRRLVSGSGNRFAQIGIGMRTKFN